MHPFPGIENMKHLHARFLGIEGICRNTSSSQGIRGGTRAAHFSVVVSFRRRNWLPGPIGRHIITSFKDPRWAAYISCKPVVAGEVGMACLADAYKSHLLLPLSPAKVPLG